MLNLFAYGTLQIPAVMLAVTGRLFPAYPARLDGYSRHCLRGKSFPGIRRCPGASVEGLVLAEIDADTLRKLDEFEDAFYRRDPVQATGSDGTPWAAQAYVIREESYGLLLPEDWDIAAFQSSRLPAFLSGHV